jgi:FKBP-type peptidyl-prolyl cis-trans isomerase
VSTCIYALPSAEERNNSKTTSSIVNDALSVKGSPDKTVPDESFDNPLSDLPAPKSITEKFSYAYAYILYLSTQKQGYDLDSIYFAKGALDAMNRTGIYEEDELNVILQDMQEAMLNKASTQLEELASENLEQANNYLVMNKELSKVNVTDSGLQYKLLEPSEGETPESGQQVTLNYQIHLMDGTLVGQSNGDDIYLVDNNLPGFVEGLKLMQVGSKYRFWVHPDLAYGAQGANNIEPNCLLIFDVELKSIEDETVVNSLKIK